MALSKKYRSYGIRRENNLSDLADPKAALNSLLDQLTEESGKTFVTEDLDAIRGLKNTSINIEILSSIASIAKTYTYVNSANVSIEDVYEPIIRFKDDFNIYRSITGKPGALGSGLGPDAWLIPSNRIAANSVINKSSTVNTIVPSFLSNKTGFIKEDDYWITGEFFNADKFNPSFPDQNGGAVWTGYFIPYPDTTDVVFRVDTTGLFHVEVDRFDNNNWEVIKSIYSNERTFTVTANVVNSISIPIANNEGKFISIGEFLSTNASIYVTNVTANTVTLSEPINTLVNSNISFKFNVGKDTINPNFSYDRIYNAGDYFGIRMIWWYPSNVIEPDKYFRLAVGTSSAAGYGLFNLFSNNAPSAPNDSEIRNLLNNAVTPTQENIGNQGQYVKFQSSKTFRSTYIPKINFSDVNLFGGNTSSSITFLQGRQYITGNTSRLANTSSGNYILDASNVSFDRIPKGMRIKKFVNNEDESSIRTTNISFPSSNATVSVYSIDHNGLIDYFVSNTFPTNTSVIVNNTSKLRPGMVCLVRDKNFSTYTRIVSVGNSTIFTTSDNISTSPANTYILIYSDSGVLDTSKDVFCAGVIGRETAAAVLIGDTSIPLTANTGLVAGMRIQFSGAIEPVNAVTVTSISGNNIIISAATTGAIRKNATITFAPSASTGDKQQCVLPLDLSPPFVGVSDGIDTNGKTISSSATTFRVIALNLSATNVANSIVTNTDKIDAKIKINGSYRLLAKKP